MNRGVSVTQRVIMICLVIGSQQESTHVDCSELPCDFSVSMNISAGIQLQNGSILFYGIEFSSTQYSQIDYTLVNGTKTATQPYFRGCLCNDDQFNKYCHLCGKVETTPSLKVKCEKINNINDIYLETILNIHMIISMPCIIATIFVYSWLPGLCNIHGKSLICYLIFLGCNNILIIIGEERIGRYFDLIYYFLVLCMIQWMHVITFDIWRNLKRWNTDRKLPEGKRFCLYSLYVCSTPFVLLGIVVLMRHMSFDLMTALHTCHAFFIIISIINVIFFILIIWNIVQTKQGVIDSENHRLMSRFIIEQQRFVLYFRMFIVTGIVTSIAVFSNFYFENDTVSHGLDIFLSLQPILLFILLILKRTTIDKIIERWNGSPNQTHRNVTPASSNTRTGSSDI